MTPEQLGAVETYVNQAIDANVAVTMTEMDKSEAIERGVEGSFWEKYPDRVKVYTFEDPDGKIWSRELCGGPHVSLNARIGGNRAVQNSKRRQRFSGNPADAVNVGLGLVDSAGSRPVIARDSIFPT